MLSFFAWPLGKLLTWFYNFLGSYGWALVLLVAVIKLALYPLYAKQMTSSAHMVRMQPKIKQIQAQYANDAQEMNAKVQELYKKEHYSPAAGCLPMLIQMFVLFGLFELLRHPIKYVGDTAGMLFAVHESFLWIADLSQPDKWILPIAAAIATYVSFTMSQKQTSTGGNDPTASSMKFMKYFFPIMILLMARSYPAGLSIYWFFGQVIQIFFNLRFAVVRRKILAMDELAEEAEREGRAKASV